MIDWRRDHPVRFASTPPGEGNGERGFIWDMAKRAFYYARFVVFGLGALAVRLYHDVEES